MHQRSVPWVVGVSALLLGTGGCGRIHFGYQEAGVGDVDGMDAGDGHVDAMDGSYPGDVGSMQDVSATWDAFPDGSSVADATPPPDASDAATSDTGAGCTVASDSCWDVWGVHTKTDFERVANFVFEQDVVDGEKVYGLFDGSSDTPKPEDSTDCSGFYMDRDKPKGWEIWRTAIDADTYRIQVDGGSDADCGKGQPVAAGEIQIRTDEWQIGTVVECKVTNDELDSNDTLIETWCRVDASGGRVTWQSGSTCGGCCACPDGAGVTIDFTVVRK